MRRRSGGAQGGDGREEGGSVPCVWISNKKHLWERGEGHLLLMLWVGAAWRDGQIREREAERGRDEGEVLLEWT